MGFFIATVSKWESPKDSKGRVPVRDRTHGKFILLNGNRMSEIQQKGSRTKLYYKDNPADPKEGKSYIEVEDHYLAVIAAVNTAYGSEYVALVDPVTAEVTYVRSEDIAFAFADSSIASDTWITYVAGDDLTRRKVDNHLLSLATSTILYDYDGTAYKYVRI